MRVDYLFDRFGRSVRLYTVATEQYSQPHNAIIQPLRYKNKMYLADLHLPAGIGNMGYYLYLGSASVDITALQSEEVYIEAGGEKYFITKAEKVYFGENPIYIWAILKTVREVSD